jgi:ferrous-iron efflux pump FieF
MADAASPLTTPLAALPVEATREMKKAARLLRLGTTASVAVALVLIAIKGIAWWLSDSVAVLSSLVDSLLDAGASLLTFFAVRASLQPADREHRFGHGKAEALASLGQSAFVAGSGFLLLFEASRRLAEPRAVSYEYAAIAVMLVSIVLTLALVLYQAHVVRQTGSLAISGDSLHYKGDLFTNASVIAALALHLVFGWKEVDALFAIAIVAYILWSAWQIGSAALDQLMDRELSDAERARILEIARAHSETRAVHDMRTRKAGLSTFIQLHLELDAHLSLVRAHRIADEVEAAILAEFPTAEVIIHQDPSGYETEDRGQTTEDRK